MTEEGAFNLEFAFDVASSAVSNLHATLAELSSRYRAAGLDPFAHASSVDSLKVLSSRVFQMQVEVGAGLAVMSTLMALRAVEDQMGKCVNASHYNCRVAQEARNVFAHPDDGVLILQSVGSEAITLRFLTPKNPGAQVVDRVLDDYAECLSVRMASARDRMPEFTDSIRAARVRYLQARNRRLPPRQRDFADGRRWQPEGWPPLTTRPPSPE